MSFIFSGREMDTIAFLATMLAVGIQVIIGIIVAFIVMWFMFQIWPPVILYRLSRWLVRSNR